MTPWSFPDCHGTFSCHRARASRSSPRCLYLTTVVLRQKSREVFQVTASKVWFALTLKSILERSVEHAVEQEGQIITI